MARIDVLMPQMGESITEGTMSRWIKKLGEPVKRDEPIFEISTDKVDAEIPAPNAGVLAEVLVTEGQTVAVGTIVARIETDGSAAIAAPVASKSMAPAAVAPVVEPAKPVAVKPTAAPAPAKPAAAIAPVTTTPVAPLPSTPPESAQERLQRKATPLVRKMVEDHGLDLGAIPGSGSAGRVTRDDVLSYLGGGAASEPAAAPAAEGPRLPAAPPAAGVALPPLPSVPEGTVVATWEGDRVEPWSKIRKLTADHMVLSRRVSAHVNSLIEIDFTHVASLRKRYRENFAERGVNLTYLAFIIKAVADTLRNHPVVNAAVSGDNTIYRRDINIGMAVALDWGLIVPVIRHADELSLLGIARAIEDLAGRARGKRLTGDDIQRGTFTITNPGGFGTFVGTPVINQPQVAILAVGAIEKRVSVLTLPDGTDTQAIRTKGMLCLAYDHRIVDGADADRFLAELRQALQNFPEQQG